MSNVITLAVRYHAIILFLLLRHDFPQCRGHELTLRGGNFDPHDNHYHSHSFHNHRSLGEEHVNEDGIPICGFPDPPEGNLQILGASHDSALLRKIAKFLKRLWHADRHHDKNRIIVPTFYHIIQSDTVAGPSAARVQEQHDHLVEAFAPYGFSFILKNVTFTRNNEWFGYKGYNTIQERRMKTALRKGGPESLNIYVNNGNGVCGYAYLPRFYASFPWNDGIVINFRCFAGHTPSQEGDVVVHETVGCLFLAVFSLTVLNTNSNIQGHWLGLLHTVSFICTSILPH